MVTNVPQVGLFSRLIGLFDQSCIEILGEQYVGLNYLLSGTISHMISIEFNVGNEIWWSGSYPHSAVFILIIC